MATALGGGGGLVATALAAWMMFGPQEITQDRAWTEARRMIDTRVAPDAALRQALAMQSAGFREVAAALLDYAGAHGNAEAARRLGVMLDPSTPQPRGGAPEPKAGQAYGWYAKAIELGDSEAVERQLHLGAWLEAAARRGDPDVRQAYREHRMAAAKTLIESQAPPRTAAAEAATAQDSGLVDIAILLFRYAADRGDSEAARRLGMLYDPTEDARGAERQPKANARFAYTWYAKASELGDAEARRRQQRLMEWARGAARDGDADAQQLLERPGQP
jgi:TPR repeat protein